MSNNAKKIIEYIKNKGQVTANELVDYLGISRQALFKHHLSKMIDENVLVKVGRPPKVYYSMATVKKLQIEQFNINDAAKKKIENDFLIITPSGERKEGLDGFLFWCHKNKLPVEKTALEFLKTVLKYDTYKKDGLIDGLSKIKSTFTNVDLDELYYLDFYSIERFGKTKLGQLLLYAKQSQNKFLMKEVIAHIKPSIDKIIKKFKVDGIGFIPPTVKRENQLMKVLEKGLHENIRKIKITKIKTMVAVPQKTLNKLEDRVENAKNTIIVEGDFVFRNILLIDDAVGSGATLNETAKKIRNKKICKGKIIGVALTGSFKGFDVISEV
jgi:hypothetical protein